MFILYFHLSFYFTSVKISLTCLIIQLGLSRPFGHIDFYPNGGSAQPGCQVVNIGCSHHRALSYYIDALNNPSCHMTGTWANIENDNNDDDEIRQRSIQATHTSINHLNRSNLPNSRTSTQETLFSGSWHELFSRQSSRQVPADEVQ